VQHRSFDIRPPPANPQRRTYLGITGVLLVIVLALAGGIIWFNTKKSNQLVVAAADRMIEEVGEHVSDRLKLIYDPMYVIIGTASLMPELTSPSIAEDPRALSLIRREGHRRRGGFLAANGLNYSVSRPPENATKLRRTGCWHQLFSGSVIGASRFCCSSYSMLPIA
jgi:hypothetical protein